MEDGRIIEVISGWIFCYYIYILVQNYCDFMVQTWNNCGIIWLSPNSPVPAQANDMVNASAPHKIVTLVVEFL